MSPNDVENCKKCVHLKTMYNISTKNIYNAVFLEGVDRDPTKPKSHTILLIPQDSYLYKLWLLWTQNYPFGRVQRSKPKVAVMGSKQVPNVTCPLLWRYSGHVPISPPSRPRRTDWALHLHPTTTLTINLTRMTNGHLKIWMSCWCFFWTCCKDHADVFQEGLVLYLEVCEEEDNLNKKMDEHTKDLNNKGLHSFHLFPISSGPLQDLHISFFRSFQLDTVGTRSIEGTQIQRT